MLVLGIETSCDETGVALFDTEQGLLAHALYSQIDMHADYGGVVPELASGVVAVAAAPAPAAVAEPAATAPAAAVPAAAAVMEAAVNTTQPSPEVAAPVVLALSETAPVAAAVLAPDALPTLNTTANQKSRTHYQCGFFLATLETRPLSSERRASGRRRPFAPVTPPAPVPTHRCCLWPPPNPGTYGIRY